MTASAMVTLSARIGLDRIDDLGVAGAAAEVAFERGADGLAVGARLALEEGERRQQHARRTEAALHRAVAYERFLQRMRSEEHTSELQSHSDLVCRLLLEKKNKQIT